MKKIIIIFFAAILIACSTNNPGDITITPISNEKDIMSATYFESEDSVAVFIPYAFEITNNTGNDIDLTGVKRNSMDEIETFNDEGINLKYQGKGLKLIETKEKRKFYVYLRTVAAKSSLDSIQWKKGLDEENFADNPALHELEEFKLLQKKLENDSIAFRFRITNSFFVIKVCKINEDKFKTFNTDDVLKNPERRHENIYKP